MSVSVNDESVSARALSSSMAGFNVAAHGLRGFAALAVFCAHILGGTAKHIYNGNVEYVGLIERPWNFGIYGVELFFIISGFVIVPSALKYAPREFLLHRFWRLYPLFFAFTALFAILNFYTNSYPWLNSLATIVSSFTFLNLFTGTEQLTPNAWTLTYEVIFYVLICFLFFAYRRTASVAAQVLSVILCAAFLIAFPIAFYFLAGAAIRFLHTGGYLYRGPGQRILEGVFAFASIWLASEPHFEYRWDTMITPVPPLTIIFSALYFYMATLPGSATSAAFNNRALAYLGTVSYSLYLVHPYTYFVTRAVFVELGLFGENPYWSVFAFFLAALPITLIVTHVVHVLLERGPYRAVFGKDIYRTRSA